MWSKSVSWSTVRSCTELSILIHATGSLWGSRSSGKCRFLRVKGLAVSGEKSILEILVTQLLLAAHNNKKSERYTNCDISSQQCAGPRQLRETSQRLLTQSSKYSDYIMSVFVFKCACPTHLWLPSACISCGSSNTPEHRMLYGVCNYTGRPALFERWISDSLCVSLRKEGTKAARGIAHKLSTKWAFSFLYAALVCQDKNSALEI